MKLIVGLGNPGEKYQNSRHNLGFMAVDHLAAGKSWSQSKTGLLNYTWVRWEENKIELIKPQTFMNRSGQAVAYVTKKHSELQPVDIYVIHDDLDLELGYYKLQLGTGPRQHNGLLSIYEALKTDQFWHLRLGIDGRAGQRQMPSSQYVLANFTPQEKEKIQPTLNKARHQLKENIFHHAQNS